VKLYVATSNQGKLREFRELGRGLEIEAMPGIAAIEPPEETGATFEENAILKAVYYSSRAPGMLFAEDSGIEVDALGGAPGVRSARFAGEGANDEDNNRLLLDRLRGIEDRKARYVSVIALARGGELVQTFRGTVEGAIANAPRGTNGFGYDPLFFYEPLRKTFGEISMDEKNPLSHRGRSFAKLVKFLL
jgi:XTP/dITP diphosphohydrolase